MNIIFLLTPKNSPKCEYKLAKYETLIIHRSTALVFVLMPVSSPGVLVSLIIFVFITLSGQQHLLNAFASDK